MAAPQLLVLEPQQLVRTCSQLTSAGLLYSTPRYAEAVKFMHDSGDRFQALLRSIIAHLQKPAFEHYDALWALATEALAASDDLIEAAGLKASPLYRQAWQCLLALAHALQAGRWKTSTYLADVLLLQGEFTEAEARFAEALELCQTELPFGSNSLEAGTVLVKRAWCFRVTGQYDEALRCYSEARDIFQAALGSGSAAALLATNGVANVLNHRKSYAEAEALHREVLQGRCSALGPRHPETATSMNNLGNVLEDQGSWEEARDMYCTAYEARAESLGRAHADTLNSLLCWMTALEHLGQGEQAQEIRQSRWPAELT